MSKLIQIVYTKNPGELTNRKSALGSSIMNLSEILLDAGFRVRLNQWDAAELKAKVEMPEGHAPASSRSPLPIPKKVKALLRDWMLLRKYKGIFEEIGKQERPDAILEYYSFGSDVGYQLSKKWDCPLYLVYDAPIRDEYKIFNGFHSPLQGRVDKAESNSLRHASGIVAYSDAVKDYLTDLVKLEKNDHIHLYQTVDFSRLVFDETPKPAEPIVIGFVGSFLRWHRVDLQVKVFERLKAEGHNIELLLVGAGMEYPAIKAQVEASPYKDAIEMTGFQDGDDLFRSKQRMHIGVMGSSNWYGAPIKLFEYGAMGMACVAPRTPTIEYIFDEEQVFMFENHDEEGLYQALKKYLDKPAMIVQKGKDLRKFIRRTYNLETAKFFYSNLLQADYLKIT